MKVGRPYYNFGKRAAKSRFSSSPGQVPVGGVGPSGLADGSVSDRHVSSGANLNGAKLALASLPGDRIPNRAISGLHIQLGAVADENVASGIAATKLTGALSSTVTIDASSVAISNINASNITSGALALTRLGTGALASGITVDNSNFSGTALALAKLATGALPSGLTVDNSNFSGTALANTNLASGIDPSKLTGSGTVPLAGLTGITTAQISAAAGLLGSQMRAGTMTKREIGQRQISNIHMKSGTLTADRVANTGTQPLGNNLLLYSEQFDNAAWQDSVIGGPSAPVRTANATAAPDGTTTAEQLAYPAVSTAGSGSAITQPITVTADVHTFSVWLKRSSGTSTIYLMASPDGVTWYHQACSVTTTWTRFSLTTGTLTGTTWYFALGVDLRDAGQSGQSAQTIFAWGAQVEQAPEAGPYVRTTSAQASEAASTYPTVAGLTETHIASIDASVAALSNLDATQLTRNTVPLARLSGITASQLAVSAGILGTQLDAAAGIVSGQITSLAATKISAGALASGVTINNANWSGTALANANLASGVDPSKLTGSGTVPLAGLAGITTTQLSGSAGILGSQLQAALRQTFAVKRGTTKAITLSDTTALALDTEVADPQDVWNGAASADTFTPLATAGGAVTGRIKVHIHVRGSGVQLGYSAQVLVVSGSTVGIAGPWCWATNDASALLQPEIHAVLDRTYSFTAGSGYKFRVLVRDQSGTAQTSNAAFLTTAERLAQPIAWSAGRSVSVGDVVRPSAANGHAYRCTTAGTTSASGHEPIWATGDYSTTSDNNNGGTSTVVWTEDGSDVDYRPGSYAEFHPSP